MKNVEFIFQDLSAEIEAIEIMDIVEKQYDVHTISIIHRNNTISNMKSVDAKFLISSEKYDYTLEQWRTNIEQLIRTKFNNDVYIIDNHLEIK